MTTNQEWQSSNLVRSFPFSEIINLSIAADKIPKDFFLDLVFFSDYYEENLVYISSINYSNSSDKYRIIINYVTDNSVAIDEEISRLASGSSRVGKRVSIKASHGSLDITGKPENYSVCCFTPGPAWESAITDPTVLSNLSSLSSSDSLIEKSITTASAKTLKRIFIEPTAANTKTNTVFVQSIPPKKSWGREFDQKIISGNNISIYPDGEDDSVLVIDAHPNKRTTNGPQDDGIKFINDIGAQSEKGEFFFNTKDCLKKIEKPFDTTTLAKIDHHLQVLSDCLPCCGCEKYRAISEAISRRSRKLEELCKLLTDMVVANSLLYNDVAMKINASRTPIVRIRNLRVYEDRFKVSVQNSCVLPLYIQIGLSITGGFGIEPLNFGILQSGVSFAASTNTYATGIVPPLSGTSKDYLNATPELASGFYRGFVWSSAGMAPISPGGYTDLTFVINNKALIVPGFDLRNNNLTIKCESNGIYGGQLDTSGAWIGTYGCKKDKWCATCVTGVPITSTSCGETKTRDTWDIIEIPCT